MVSYPYSCLSHILSALSTLIVRDLFPLYCIIIIIIIIIILFVQDSRSNDRVLQLMLQETDYISLLDQFPITDIFKYLLCGREGQYPL